MQLAHKKKNIYKYLATNQTDGELVSSCYFDFIQCCVITHMLQARLWCRCRRASVEQPSLCPVYRQWWTTPGGASTPSATSEVGHQEATDLRH